MVEQPDVETAVSPYTPTVLRSACTTGANIAPIYTSCPIIPAQSSYLRVHTA
jgi:hypothetical protein